jgi:hypothetical protein
VEAGLPQMVSVGAGVGIIVLVYCIFWLMICKFQEFSF